MEPRKKGTDNEGSHIGMEPHRTGDKEKWIGEKKSLAKMEQCRMKPKDKKRKDHFLDLNPVKSNLITVRCDRMCSYCYNCLWNEHEVCTIKISMIQSDFIYKCRSNVMTSY